MEHKGLRYNEGKVRAELLPSNALHRVAKVFTKGAEKYSPRNWESGMSWSTVLASLKRHLLDYEAGFDIDPDDGLPLIDKVATNALFLVEYSDTYPQGDDRQKKYLKVPKIALDIDEVIADWTGAYCRRFNMPLNPTSWNFDRKIRERSAEIREDKDFWINLEPKIEADKLPFEPVAYITSRTIPTAWTEEWLDKNNFPTAPVFTVAPRESKFSALEESGSEILIDDSYDTFVDISNRGKCCFLFDAPHNKRYDVGARRLNSLNDLFWVRGL